MRLQQHVIVCEYAVSTPGLAGHEQSEILNRLMLESQRQKTHTPTQQTPEAMIAIRQCERANTIALKEVKSKYRESSPLWVRRQHGNGIFHRMIKKPQMDMPLSHIAWKGRSGEVKIGRVRSMF